MCLLPSFLGDGQWRSRGITLGKYFCKLHSCHHQCSDQVGSAPQQPFHPIQGSRNGADFIISPALSKWTPPKASPRTRHWRQRGAACTGLSGNEPSPSPKQSYCSKQGIVFTALTPWISQPPHDNSTLEAIVDIQPCLVSAQESRLQLS